jgi:hypothetical protein
MLELDVIRLGPSNSHRLSNPWECARRWRGDGGALGQSPGRQRKLFVRRTMSADLPSCVDVRCDAEKREVSTKEQRGEVRDDARVCMESDLCR